MKRIRNWADAPSEILGLIAERLNSIEDSASFRGVCKSWRSVALEQPHSNVSSKTLPWIMFPRYSDNGDDDDDGTNILHAFSLSACRWYKLKLPEATDTVISGSPYGWIVLSCLPHMEMFNPLTHVKIPLPPISTLEGYTASDSSYFHNEVFLFIAEERILVLTIFWEKGEIAFTRPGDEYWTPIHIPITCYDDMLIMNNQLYIIDTEGIVTLFDITSGSSPVGLEFALPPDDIRINGDVERTFYFVEMLGDLYTVVKFERFNDLCTGGVDDGLQFESLFAIYFRVFRLCLGTRRWEEVFTLGDYAIFVGRITSFSLLVSEHPDSKSSIYFTDCCSKFGVGKHTGRMGIFNLDTMTLMALDPGADIVNLHCTPFWFIPNL